MGLAGIFINQKDREGQGIVAPGDETRKLQEEIAEKLTGLTDPASGEVAVHAVYAREKIYNGPYVKAAPDLIIGYNVGYRVSWESAVGKTSKEVILDNTHAWSGDHCIDPHLVPGVLFCNRKLRTEDVSIVDIAPTAMDLFGVKKPAYLDGKTLLCEPASN
jgi:predicted AlkP superfamily phosphohydrolase/phosphomutase